MKEPVTYPSPPVSAPDPGSFERRPFHERKAALNLLQLAGSCEASISPDKVTNLIGTLIVSYQASDEWVLCVIY